MNIIKINNNLPGVGIAFIKANVNTINVIDKIKRILLLLTVNYYYFIEL